MQVRVNISDEVLKWIIDQVNFDSLSEEVRNNLIRWKNKDIIPTFNQIEKMSKATGIPLGYFFLKTPPVEKISLIDYRTIDSLPFKNPSQDLIDTIHDMEFVQGWMRDYLISEDASVVPFVGAYSQETDIKNFANGIREILNLTVDWFKNSNDTDDSFKKIRSAISGSGVIVMMSGIVGNNTHRALDVYEFRAFTLIDEYAPLIFINSNDSAGAKLFSLLHEFAHICIGENSLYNDRYGTGEKIKKSEIICNAVAAEIIVPRELFIKEWSNTSKYMDEEQAIKALAKNFHCGITVIARKALDNGFIDKSLYEKVAQYAVQLYNEQRKRQKESKSNGGDYYKTISSRIDKRFFQTLVSSVMEGRTLYSDAFRLTYTNSTTFQKLMKSMGVV